MKHVLKPVERPFSPEIEKILVQYPRGADGNIIKLFRVFANSLRFLSNKGVTNLLDKDSPLSLKEREIIILRVTANKNCEYEWGIHVSVFSKAAGLSEKQLAATKLSGSDADIWSTEESLLIKCVDDICLHALIRDDTYTLFQEQWNLEQQLEILALCGNYHTVSFVANTARIPIEEIGEKFPPSL
ncbi:MAG: carboxymuconolactone decarboxylase family protein [Spongiibacteraceae bacterium]|nr:carboxymuconolactone decarboxylase family protein [Spongiibacteraceae bacterium]